jgi:hypothetical protein
MERMEVHFILAATTQNIYLSPLIQAFEPILAVSERSEQTAKQIGSAIEAAKKSLSIPPVQVSSLVRDMLDAWKGKRLQACARLANGLPFQLPDRIKPTLKRMGMTETKLVTRCIYEIMERSQSMPVRTFDAAQTGPAISRYDLTMDEARKWLIAEVYRVAPLIVFHMEDRCHPQVLVNQLPVFNESGVWLTDLDIRLPDKGRQLPASPPKRRRGQPKKLEETTSPEEYLKWCQDRWWKVYLCEDPPPNDEEYGAKYGVSAKTVSNWRARHQIPPPRSLRIKHEF